MLVVTRGSATWKCLDNRLRQIALSYLAPQCFLRVHKSTKPLQWSLSTTPFTSSPGLASSEDRFLTVFLSYQPYYHLFSASLGWSYSFYSILFVKMFSKSFIAPIFLLALTSSVNAHAGITPALGVKGNLARSDVQRPSTAQPCGNINIAQNLDTSTAVNADASGNFLPSITNFNP